MILNVLQFFRSKRKMQMQIELLNSQVFAMKQYISDLESKHKEMQNRLRVMEQLHDISQSNHKKSY